MAPLDWGLGHATRCVPVIRGLLAAEAEVVIAADGSPLHLLRNEFPELEFLEFAGYDISYPDSGSMALKMLLETPKILKKIKWEQGELQRIVDEHNIDGVVSDNRFGLHSDKVPCVFMTHQIHIQAPVFKGALYRKNLSYIKHYDECWIPDFEGGENLSGALSHNVKMPENAFYIGPLSRLAEMGSGSSSSGTYGKVVVLISGPEPQRSAFEQLVIAEVSKRNDPVLILRGKPGDDMLPPVRDHIEMKNHMESEALAQELKAASWVLCRPGYSSLMDLASIGAKAVFIPTPGQTEQEYLARFHQEKGHYFSQSQHAFNYAEASAEVHKYAGIKSTFDDQQLQTRITALLNRIS